jgi:hypothetical protein
MEDREIDLRLREVFRRNEPSFGQSQADMVNQAVSLRHVARGGRRSVLRLATVTVAVLVVGIGVAVGVWQIFIHSGGSTPVAVITDQTTATPATATTSAVSASSTTIAVQPLVDETQLRRAAEVVSRYFSYLKAGKSADFKKLIGPGIGMDADTLWTQERAGLKKSGQAAYALHSWHNIAWAGDQYVLPWVMVPTDIDQWIRTDPSNRVGVQATMQDGTVRYFRIEHQTKTDTWLLIPTEFLLGEPPASVMAIPFATEQSKALAERMAAAVAEAFPTLAGTVIEMHGIEEATNMPEFVVSLVDNLRTPQWALEVLLQKNVSSVAPASPEKSQPITLAGSTSGWIDNGRPWGVQIVIVLPNNTMVNVVETARGLDPRNQPLPLDDSELKALVELVAEQFGAIDY